LWNPSPAAFDVTIAYLLLSVGFLGVMVEATHPGTLVPGVVGAVFVSVGFASLIWNGTAGPAVAMLLGAEAVALLSALWTRHQWLTWAGIAGFALGSLLLLQATDVSFFVVGAIVVLVAMSTFALAGAARRARSWPAKTGLGTLIGREAISRGALEPEGFILVNGELWRARSVAGTIAAGETVRVLRVEGLTLIVAPRGRGQVEDLRLIDRRESA